MKLVPLKPTLEMALAAEDASMACNRLAESNQLPPDAHEWPTQRIWHCVRVYEAMIAAAPAAPTCAVAGRQDVALDPMAGTLSQGIQPAAPVSLTEDVIDDLWGKRTSIIQFARAVEQAAHAMAQAAFADQAHAWHSQIRTALGLDAHAPWRFDQYAHLIEQSITADATRNSARKAWEAVVALLDELRPGWEVGNAPPRQLALDLIRSALGGPDVSSKTGCLSQSADSKEQPAPCAKDVALPPHWQAFQFNSDWLWEQVTPSAADDPGVVKAYTADQLRAAVIADRQQRSGDRDEPIAWESTTLAYTKHITDSKYRKFSSAVRRWYRPYRCAACESRRRPGAAMDERAAFDEWKSARIAAGEGFDAFDIWQARAALDATGRHVALPADLQRAAEPLRLAPARDLLRAANSAALALASASQKMPEYWPSFDSLSYAIARARVGIEGDDSPPPVGHNPMSGGAAPC